MVTEFGKFIKISREAYGFYDIDLLSKFMGIEGFHIRAWEEDNIPPSLIELKFLGLALGITYGRLYSELLKSYPDLRFYSDILVSEELDNKLYQQLKLEFPWQEDIDISQYALTPFMTEKYGSMYTRIMEERINDNRELRKLLFYPKKKHNCIPFGALKIVLRKNEGRELLDYLKTIRAPLKVSEESDIDLGSSNLTLSLDGEALTSTELEKVIEFIRLDRKYR